MITTLQWNDRLNFYLIAFVLSGYIAISFFFPIDMFGYGQNDGFYVGVFKVHEGIARGTVLLLHQLRYMVVYPFWSAHLLELGFLQNLIFVPIWIFFLYCLPKHTRLIGAILIFSVYFISARLALTSLGVFFLYSFFSNRTQNYAFAKIILSFLFCSLSSGTFLAWLLASGFFLLFEKEKLLSQSRMVLTALMLCATLLTATSVVSKFNYFSAQAGISTQNIAKRFSKKVCFNPYLSDFLKTRDITNVWVRRLVNMVDHGVIHHIYYCGQNFRLLQYGLFLIISLFCIFGMFRQRDFNNLALFAALIPTLLIGGLGYPSIFLTTIIYLITHIDDRNLQYLREKIRLNLFRRNSNYT